MTIRRIQNATTALTWPARVGPSIETRDGQLTVTLSGAAAIMTNEALETRTAIEIDGINYLPRRCAIDVSSGRHRFDIDPAE